MLQTKDFYEPISVNECFLTARHLHYTFVKKLLKNGISIESTVLFVQHYAGAKGNVYFIWKEASTSDNSLSLRNELIQNLVRSLPKYFLWGHKQRMKTLTENLMLENISCAEFWAIYAELTGDQSVSNTKITRGRWAAQNYKA